MNERALCVCLYVCVRRAEGGNGIRGNTFWQGWESHLTPGLLGTWGERGERRWWGKGEIGGLIRVHLWEVIPRALRIWGFGFRSTWFC